MGKEKTTIDFATVIIANFSPADSAEDATLRLSTAEISERIKEHFGQIVTDHEVYLKLKEFGFKEYSDSEMVFFWLLKQK